MIGCSENTINQVRGPEEHWVNSYCPACDGYYFGAALDYAQRLHDKRERCTGQLVVLTDDLPTSAPASRPTSEPRPLYEPAGATACVLTRPQGLA